MDLLPPRVIRYVTAISSFMTPSRLHRDDQLPFEPLPDNKFSPQTHPSWHDAHTRCTLLFWAVGCRPRPVAASTPRLGGGEAPTERGQDWLCKGILSCWFVHPAPRANQESFEIPLSAI